MKVREIKYGWMAPVVQEYRGRVWPIPNTAAMGYWRERIDRGMKVLSDSLHVQVYVSPELGAFLLNVPYALLLAMMINSRRRVRVLWDPRDERFFNLQVMVVLLNRSWRLLGEGEVGRVGRVGRVGHGGHGGAGNG